MPNNLGFWLIWILFVVYAFIFAPPDRPDTITLIQKLIAGDWQGTNEIGRAHV